MSVVLFVLFFFFKQKTAYEMRISDWSSDVCSSDLHQGAGQRHGQRPRRHQRPAGGGDGGIGGGRRLGERHCSRPRTKMVAAVNVTSAIAASGHRLERMSVGGIALRTLPCTITRKWVSGIACASHCSATGMFSTGVAKPDISTAGTPMAKAPRIACCWVLLTAETISPMPTTERMNSTRPSNSSRNEPVNGMPNTNEIGRAHV